MNKNNNRPNYGNWVSRTLINKLIMILVALFVVFAAATFFQKRNGGATLITGILSDAFLIMALVVAYFVLVSKELSFGPGGVLERFHDKLIEKLPWDGEGKLLEVGCGSGALTVKCAKTFDEAAITACDPWSAKRDFTLTQCEDNAMLEGVADRITYIKENISDLTFPTGEFDAVVSCFAYRFDSEAANKRDLIKETLRPLKEGGAFAIIDMFGNLRAYGSYQSLQNDLEESGISEVNYITGLDKELGVPGLARFPGMVTGVGMIYGKK